MPLDDDGYFLKEAFRDAICFNMDDHCLTPPSNVLADEPASQIMSPTRGFPTIRDSYTNELLQSIQMCCNIAIEPLYYHLVMNQCPIDQINIFV